MPPPRASSAESAAGRGRLARQARWQKALLGMATDPAAATGDFAAAGRAQVRLAQKAMPAERCGIWLLEQGAAGRWLRSVYLTAPGRGDRIELAGLGWMLETLASGRALDVVAAAQAGRARKTVREFLHGIGVEAALAAPIRKSGQLAGVLGFGEAGPRRWTAEEIEFAADAADHVALALESSERAQAERMLRESERRYRQFLELTAEAIWRVAFDRPVPVDASEDEQLERLLRDGYVAESNPAGAQIRGFKNAADITGMRLPDVLAPVNEERLLQLRAAIRSGYSVRDAEIRHFTPEGEERWLLRNVTGIIQDGKLVEIWGASRDITERKRYEESLRHSEQRYRAFIAHSSQGIFCHEYLNPIPVDLSEDELLPRLYRNVVMTECNDALARMRGFSSGKELIGLPGEYFRLPTPDNLQRDVQFIRNGFRIDGLESEVRDRAGGTKWFRYNASGIVENGKLSRIWGTVTDVTEQKRLEREMRALTARRAAVLEQERTRIAREIHDELGQQLTALKFDIAGFPARVSKAELSGHLDSAIQTVRRISTGLRPPVLDHFGLAAAVEWQVSEFGKRTGLQCRCDVQEDVQAGRDLATTVFRILQESLTNAARHSGASRIEVTLGQDRDDLLLRVRDDGKGIDPEVLRDRTSLGIAGMRERAADAGGRLTIGGGPGAGTTVEARFPLAVTAAEAGEAGG